MSTDKHPQSEHHSTTLSFFYSISIDWVGLLVECGTGVSLNNHFQESIFAPLNVKELNMFPAPEMLSRLWFMNKCASNGKVSLNEYGHLNQSQFLAHTPEEKKVLFNHGGHGLFGRPSEYLQIISMLLNNDTHPKMGNKILEKETVDEMFTNQIPQFPDFG